MKTGDRVKLIKPYGFSDTLIVSEISECGTLLKMKHLITGTTATRSNNEGEWFPIEDVVAFSDITILDEYKEIESDIVFTGEDSEGVLLSVTIPTVDIANYFDSDEIIFNVDADYQTAGQFVFDNWVNHPKEYDVEISLK